LFADQKPGAQQSLGCGSAETNNKFWLNQSNFGFKPGPASLNFSGIGFFVNAPLATRFPFEMLDYVGDIDLRAIDSGLGKCIVK